jgi:hypothetical protein
MDLMVKSLPGVRGVPVHSPGGAATNCPACGGTNHRTFFEKSGVPVDSFRLVDTFEEAKAFPRGDLRLAVCEQCGFIWNTAFDPSVQDYSAVFEETQFFSPRFRAFGSALVNRLIETYDIRGKDVLEIGCGPGHFLEMICEAGGNRGVGLDPHYVEKEGLSKPSTNDVRIIREYFSEKHAPLLGDLVLCRHTLEHIQPVGDLLRLVRRTLSDRSETIVFFEVPETMRILREAAFWQIYYEHCSYFTAGAMARLCRATGFQVLDLRLDFDNQYVLIEGRPGNQVVTETPFPCEETVEEVCSAVHRFVDIFEAQSAHWGRVFEQADQTDQRVVLWGGAPQSVAFGLALGVEDKVDYIVNINPVQHGKYAVGTGQQVVAPQFLKEYRPDLVILMNSIYRDEVAKSLQELGISSELMTV